MSTLQKIRDKLTKTQIPIGKSELQEIFEIKPRYTLQGILGSNPRQEGLSQGFNRYMKTEEK